MKTYKFTHQFAFLTFAVTLAALLASFFDLSVSADSHNTTVKVGYFQMDGYNEIDSDGLYSGYDYDFFQLLGRYTDLNFEYVGYDKSWQEMQQMLLDGEIDILTSMHSTEERLLNFDFSYDIGSSYTMLTIKMGNNNVQSGNYSTYEGIRVGMISESSQNAVFDAFAAENGFSYTPVYFDNASDLADAVQNETVDAAVTSSLRKLSGERVIEEINPSSFYAVVKKGNTELLDEINQGISEIDANNGDWRNTLYYRYYGYSEDSDADIVYSDREQEIINEYSKNGKTLKICFDPSLEPYSFVSDGKMVGILPDAIAETLDPIGINYEFVIPENHEEYLKMYRNAEADIFPETIADLSAQAQEIYLFTDTYFTVSIGMITSKMGRHDINSVALPDNGIFYTDLTFADKEIKRYATAEDVVNAVTNGEADAAYLMNYTAQMYINGEQLTELGYVSQPDMQYELSFSVNRDIPHEFCSIFNKNINEFASKDFYSLSLEYIETAVSDVTFVEYMQLHPKTAIILFLLAIILVIIIMALFFTNKRKADKEKQQRDLETAYEKAETALADAQQYRHAVLSDAFVVYDVNISKNIITSEVCEEYGERKISIFSRLNLPTPCSYDLYLERVCEQLTESDDREFFRSKTNRDYLLKLFEDGKTEDVFEYRTKLLNGKVADLRHTTYLTREVGTNDIIAHINNKNITAQKKNERQIRKYEQILITTATDTYKGVRRVDLDTGHAEYIRFDDGQITQTELGHWTNWLTKQSTNVHPDDYKKLIEFFSMENFHRMKPGVAYRFDYRSKATNEKNLHRVYTTTASISYIGEKKTAIMTTMDNTAAVENEMEQKQLVEQALKTAEQANMAKTTFLSNMSHDIRTPMNAIIGFTSLAETNLDNSEKVKYYLEKISTSSIHLLSLINDVLDMSRIESGRLQLDESECSLLELIENVKSIILPDLTAKGLNFTASTENLANEAVICDKLRLNRILLNLLGNAIKFTESGGSIRLSVSESSADEKETAIYKFKVSDTGIGMSEEFISRVFEPFERERNSTVSGVQGTGLGMSITKNIVEMMGGTITVKSKKNEGTEFTVIIPMRITAAQTRTEQSTAENGSTGKREKIGGQRVLLVEDNDLNREIAAEILGAADLEVEEAEDGSVAIEKLKEKGAGYYSLILMDIQMPIMDGYTTTREIRAFEDKALANIPIIAMTANAFDEDKQKAIAAGMNAHLAKPISIETLLDTIEQVI